MLLAIISVLAGCNDNNVMRRDEPDMPASHEWTTVSIPTTFVGGVSDDDIAHALSERFVTQTSLDNATVAVIDGAQFSSRASELKPLYDQGGLIIVINPQTDTDDVIENIFSGGFCPHIDESFVDMLAFDSRDRYYSLMHKEYDIIDNQEISVEKDETSSPDDTDDDSDGDDTAIDEIAEVHEHDKNCDQLKIDDFIEWLGENFPISRSGAGSGNSYDPRLDISNDYASLSVCFPIQLNNKIDKGTLSKEDRLDAESTLVYDIKVYPLFQHSCNGGSAPGDYYIIDATVTAKNGALWKPYTKTHGATKDLVIGYYMKELTSKYSLSDMNGNDIPGLTFYSSPTPETTRNSKTYTSGFAGSFNGSIGGKAGTKSGLEGSTSFGFNLTWSNSTSYTLDDISTELETPSNRVNYKYTVENISYSRNFDKKERNIPGVARTDMVGHCCWVWKIPYGQNGVEDNATTGFKMKVEWNAVYGAYNWWRAASWSYKHEYSPTNDRNHVRTKTWEMPVPNRLTMGVLSLENATDNTVRNIKVWKKENGSDVLAYSIPSSYGKNKQAKCKLREGTYSVTWELVDANQDNKVISTWRYDNVGISQGANENDATTFISTADSGAEKQN